MLSTCLRTPHLLRLHTHRVQPDGNQLVPSLRLRLLEFWLSELSDLSVLSEHYRSTTGALSDRMLDSDYRNYRGTIGVLSDYRIEDTFVHYRTVSESLSDTIGVTIGVQQFAIGARYGKETARYRRSLLKSPVVPSSPSLASPSCHPSC